MKFERVGRRDARALSARSAAFLVEDGWDDFGYKTLFQLIYFDKAGKRHNVGDVKILQVGMTSGRTAVPEKFNKLDPSFASIGLESAYYETLHSLGEITCKRILTSLKDVVWSEDVYGRVKNEDSFSTSLMRGLSRIDIGHYRDVVNGRATSTPFHFTYRLGSGADQALTFQVVPHVSPPTNIHTIIGRNGVGKTHLLKSLLSWLCDGEDKQNPKSSLKFESLKDEFGNDATFANVIHVAFSAFDAVDFPTSPNGTKTGIQLAYVGLRRPLRKARLRKTTEGLIVEQKASSTQSRQMLTQLKSLTELQNEFVASALACVEGAQKRNWLAVMALLESDPVFGLMGLQELVELTREEFFTRAGNLFKKASSGHKVVLLSVTRLVELVEERSLVLIDEPEAHLHPPLQAALIRAFSFLLADRNGLAVLATHSPVMLQEVPKDCVWLLNRDGTKTTARRSEIETFAENVGTLTREVFRLEVTASGYHNLLARAVQGAQDFEEITASFRNHIGAEGRAVLRSLLFNRDARLSEE